MQWTRWAQGRIICLCLLQGSNSHWAQWEASACKLHQKLMCIKGFTEVDCSKTQCWGASMALVSKKCMFWFQSIPCWKGEKSQDFFGSYSSLRTSVSELLNFLMRIIVKVLLFSLIPPQPTAPFESEAVFFQKKRPWGEKPPTLLFKPPKGRRFSFAHERWAKQMLVYQSIAGLKHWFSFL